MAESLGIKPDSSKVFLYRLYSLITDGGVLVYRKVFTSYARQMSGSVSDHIEKYKNAIQQSFLQGGITRAQYDRLIPGRSPDSLNSCDITLLAFLVRITCVEQTASDSLHQQISDLDSLRRFRNEIAHIHSTEEYDISKFELFWRKIKSEIMKLGQGIPGLEEEIDALKEGPIDPGREADLQELMEDLRRKATVADDLANRMTQMESNFNQRMDSNQTTIIAKLQDETDARERNQTVIIDQLRKINKNPFLLLPKPCDLSLDSLDTTKSLMIRFDPMLQLEQSARHTPYFARNQQELTPETVTGFENSDYEDLSKAIGSEWPTVADHLGLSKSQIERTKAQSERSENQAYIKEMVHIWGEMEKENARIDRFIETVVNCPFIKAERSAFEGIIERHANTPQN